MARSLPPSKRISLARSSRRCVARAQLERATGTPESARSGRSCSLSTSADHLRMPNAPKIRAVLGPENEVFSALERHRNAATRMLATRERRPHSWQWPLTLVRTSRSHVGWQRAISTLGRRCNASDGCRQVGMPLTGCAPGRRPEAIVGNWDRFRRLLPCRVIRPKLA